MELMFNSSGGGVEVITVGAGEAETGSTQVCKSVLVWTFEDDVYFTIGATDAANTDALLPASTMFPVPENNTNLLQFYSTAGATVYLIYRT